MTCFFCEVQKKRDEKIFLKNEFFVSKISNFPVTKGHTEVFPKEHIKSFFELKENQIKWLVDIINKSKKILDKKFNPDGYNIGINEGEAAGRTVDHLHIHLIPRYNGDVANPVGGVRNIIPDKGNYLEQVEPKNLINKLVRDKIPEIIKSERKKPIIHIANEKEFSEKLKEKISEEVEEFLKEPCKEELADILEVIYSLRKNMKISKRELEKERKNKSRKRGAFKKKIILEEIG